MASEIVITSVPRGVKLGRTGFQVAMQTKGMRDDVAAQLEKMAGYRHLPSGAGGNPVSYFHRLTRTVAGPLHVVGRIVDAGVDFSNRSNKLAHMVVLEAAEAAGLAGSSPAAALAAIEGRLAASWPGGPEERQFPFSLAGLPASQPAPCATWQQLLGDAGWAGVIADRALRNQPTLIVSPDPSPASCRRLLALFEEALALVPPAKRWAVTFDTTVLAPDGILWRGTYAGSPESAATQPGLLVLELTRPKPIPAEAAASDLVAAARTGRGSMPQVPAASQQRVPPAAGATGAPRVPATAGGGPTAPGRVPPPLNADTEWVEVPLTPPVPARSNRGFAAALIIGGVLVALAVLATAGAVAYVAIRPPDGKPAPKIDDGHAVNKPDAQFPAPKAETTDTANTDTGESKPLTPGSPSGVDEGKSKSGPEPDAAGRVANDSSREADLLKPDEGPLPPDDSIKSAPERAFDDLQSQISRFKESKTVIWPLENSPKTLFKLSPVLAKDLPSNGVVVVGTSGDFKPVVAFSQGQASRVWTLSFDEKELARLELNAESQFVISKTSDTVDDALRCMPIGFKYPTEALKGSDWFRLSQKPVEWPLASGTNGGRLGQYTLHDLLCKYGKVSELPATGLTRSKWELLSQTIAVPDSSITLTVTPDKAATPKFIDLTFTSAGSGTVRKYALHERITLNATDRSLTIKVDRSNSPARLGPLFENADTRLELIRLGLLEDKGSRKKAEEPQPHKIPSVETNLPKIVMALLKHNDYFEDINPNAVKGLLSGWTMEKEKDAWEKDVFSLELMRTTLKTFLISDSAFRTLCHKKFAEGLPAPPLDAIDPKKKVEQEAAHGAWRANRDKDLQGAVDDRGRLQQFWDEHEAEARKWEKNKDQSGEPKVTLEELAAIKVLLELDGMILAKLHREPLESLLNSVPVSALFKGKIQQFWELDGKDLPLPVDAYNFPGATPSQAPVATPAPAQADGGKK